MRCAPPYAVLLVLILASTHVLAWGRTHTAIRQWAVKALPDWQRELLGPEATDKLCGEFKSLQDQHAGGKSPELDKYCRPPGARVSLHDVPPPEAGLRAIQWYLWQVGANLRKGEKVEAMKFLGVLCHWNEDPGSPSAHSSPITESVLRQLVPPVREKENLNYLFGYGGIADAGAFKIPEETYRPKLLGASISEAAARIYQGQRMLRYHNSRYIIPVAQDTMYGDGRKADEARAAAALYNAKHVADILYTALCLAADRVDPSEAAALATQRLTEWLSDYTGGPLIPHPYYVVPFLVNQSMDAKRKLHPLQFSGEGKAADVAHGFGMGAPFALDYTLAPGGVFAEFTCRVGLHPTAGPSGKVSFRVEVNGQVAAKTDFIAAGAPPQALKVPLPSTEVVKLTLATEPAPGSQSLDNLTVWSEPTLHRAVNVPSYQPPRGAD